MISEASKEFLRLTEKLLESDKLFSVCSNFDFNDHFFDERLDAAFDGVFLGKTSWKGGEQLPWRSWLLASGFPYSLYDKHDRNLLELIDDHTVYGNDFRSKKTLHSFFGRVCRPLEKFCGKSYMHYLLERWSQPNLRSFPNFYFDVEPIEWLWEELHKNKRQFKTGRASVTCCTNMYFRFNAITKKPIVGWILKHCEWSHLYQDIFSPCNIGAVICKQLDWEIKGHVSVYFVSLFLDDKKRAKELLRTYGH